MKILAIETSCDETAVCVLDCNGNPKDGSFVMDVLGNALHTQMDMHKEFGGVVPMMAKREHAHNLIPLFSSALTDAKLFYNVNNPLSDEQINHLTEIFGREEEFKNTFIDFIQTIGKPEVDAIAVTEGPGLEPALWMGIIFAKALSSVFSLPLIPVNHMEGHILSVLPQKIELPALALLISGGHTELVLMNEWNKYEVIGQTRDDAIGEAFDKVARMLDLPYPGGPEISKLASTLRTTTQTSTVPYILPRPMIHSKDFDFSFSGIKTAVLYSLKEKETPKEVVAKEFEDAVTEVIIAKTFRAVEEFGIKTLIIGGGVISNTHIREEFIKKTEQYPELNLLLPNKDLRTDNALMIGIAGYVNYLVGKPERTIRAQGNLHL